MLEQFTDYNLTWVNCEMGSFIMMSPRKENGSLVQTLDLLDFSVVHLSAYERLKRRWRKVLPDFINNMSKNKKDWETGSLAQIVKATKLLKLRAATMREEGTTSTHVYLHSIGVCVFTNIFICMYIYMCVYRYVSKVFEVSPSDNPCGIFAYNIYM